MMRRIICLMILTVMFSASANINGQNVSNKLIKVDSKSLGINKDEFDIEIIELERKDNISTVKIVLKKGSSVGSSLFIAYGICKIADAMKKEYFVDLDYQTHADYGIYIVGFTNSNKVDIKKEFGNQFTAVDETGEKRIFQSVRMFDQTFEKLKKLDK